MQKKKKLKLRNFPIAVSLFVNLVERKQCRQKTELHEFNLFNLLSIDIYKFVFYNKITHLIQIP